MQSKTRTRTRRASLAMLICAASLAGNAHAVVAIGGTVMQGSGTCLGDATCDYSVTTAIWAGAPAYRYQFHMVEGTGYVGAVEIPLFDPAFVIPGSVSVQTGTNWQYQILGPSDPGWDWQFSDPTGPKSAFDNIPAVLRFSALTASDYVLPSEPATFAFYSLDAPVLGPYQFEQSATAPGSNPVLTTLFFDPPTPQTANPVSAPPVLPLLGIGLLAMAAIRRGVRSQFNRAARRLPASA